MEMPTIVNYCDFSWRWNYKDFEDTVLNNQCDGCVISYKGFHPHLIGENLYASMSHRNNWMEEIQEKYWVIFFRRSMLKIANLLANKINAVALITGDSIGQVASQTLSNIRAISEVSNLPIIRPLSGMNKEEIINKAKKIGTYQTSVQPYEDCCSFFVPIHPETKAKIDEVLAIDSKIDLNIEYEEALSNIEKEKIKF